MSLNDSGGLADIRANVASHIIREDAERDNQKRSKANVIVVQRRRVVRTEVSPTPTVGWQKVKATYSQAAPVQSR